MFRFPKGLRGAHTLFYLNLPTSDCNGTKITIFLVKFIYSFITIEEQLIDNNDSNIAIRTICKTNLSINR